MMMMTRADQPPPAVLAAAHPIDYQSDDDVLNQRILLHQWSAVFAQVVEKEQAADALVAVEKRVVLDRQIVAADCPGAFVEDTPTATLVHQVLGAVAQFDKAMTVAKLRLARDRVRNRDGKCEGRKSHAEERPEAVALAKQLHRQGMGYRAISGELAKAGHINERGKPFHHKSVRAMLD